MAILCHCNGVSERTIRRSIRHGACTADEIGLACGAGTNCAACHVWLEEMLDEAAVRPGIGVAAPTMGAAHAR